MDRMSRYTRLSNKSDLVLTNIKSFDLNKNFPQYNTEMNNSANSNLSKSKK